MYFKLISIVLNILLTHPSSVSLSFSKEREKLINRLYGCTGSVFRDGKRIARVDKGVGGRNSEAVLVNDRFVILFLVISGWKGVR